ncbi:AEC family transporter [Bacillus sp. V59.32b]|uniref:AEC family transporter n=1 Tax=Bacillus sp. V59.32b TaxID=1758642 RepID=UPI000E3E1DB8|nr:AEC family transporter [Bacillus sp. V59.32b]RFU61017.1 AEC family transporter [Bacillus sp. V59.32b]
MEFLSVLLPIFGIFALGFIGQKKFHFDTKGISTMALYLMSPVLVFRTFYTTEFTFEAVYMIVYTFGLCMALILVVYLVSFLKKYSIPETCGMILASSFMNNGNYGTPVAFLLFGAVGLDYAIVLMVIQQLLMCTVGVYYAAKGSPEGNGVRSAINAVKRMPIVYGAMVGFVFQYIDIPLSAPVLSAVDLVADATIPTIMLTLGMQLANISIKQIEKSRISISLILKLAISPVIAYIITLFLPVDDLLKQIMIIMAAMPTAANTTMYALQFNTEPDFVSSATFISTTLSLATLPIIFLIVL